MAKANYYIMIPAEVHTNNKLKFSERLLYGVIRAMSSKYGFCTAPNSYFSELYDVSKTSISNWLMALKENGLIKIEFVYKNKRILGRKIYPLVGIDKKSSVAAKTNTAHSQTQNIQEKVVENNSNISDTPIQENLEGVSKNSWIGYPTIVDGNNINKININNNINMSSDSALDQKENIQNTKNDSPDIPDSQIPYQKIINYLNKRTGRSFKASNKETRRLIREKVLQGYTFEDFKKVINIKCRDWQHSAQWATYLRPSTLFGMKFKKYLFEENSKSTGFRRSNKLYRKNQWAEKRAAQLKVSAPNISEKEMNEIFNRGLQLC